ncbi:indolepyruvate ferredoxin oxidoreductase subunit alpha [[Eubacterium] tenue]|uniref:Indolepyruvate oxidoreductase subunit IorA n=1 Tax=Paeniclostridium hominis TaxID=2764329 RepID=A0ABR7K430_9FIRM|nr:MULTISPECIES: indolepyruvate ferredoxin oxidoreductase subunit alpha [Paeniclostridium]MBC6003867.1 indolepyruvate ferredoxin oxidoreductase subunit alpha [Paeniclostridium hominis]MBC8631138.1 indolepyruvate ferredoxin oxidoreductase subunit alpha [[Eubacterium] tenue]
MKLLMTGNEAIARGAYEAGVKYASAYPGTPSTEILENIAMYKDSILAEWAPNEKVALEASIGGSIAGARTLACMKHVGVNVAADPLFTFAYTGVNGGMILVSADEPGMHSSQNEQDNRNYAKFAKIGLFEPSTSQEAKDMIKEAYKVSEKYDTPILYRVTTRLCHSKGIVNCVDREEIKIKGYVKDVKKRVTVPAHARNLRIEVEKRLDKLKEYSNTTELNFMEINNNEIGIISSGVCYTYAKEVFKDNASYLKLGFTNPMPDKKIKEFANKVKKIYVIEENDKFIEDQVKSMGIDVIGKDIFPYTGEMTPDVIRKAIFNENKETIKYNEDLVVGRPPTLCSGCPHRGFFYEIGKRKNVMISGDIGCYSLGFASPYNALDSIVCMGASLSVGHGAQQVFNMKENNNMRVVGVLGDSTFFHTGINSLIDIAYNKSNTISVILDNRITGMTGHQQNPGTGYTLQGKEVEEIDIEKLVLACGIKNVKTIDPNNLEQVNKTLDWALELDEPSVIITRWPCVLKKLSIKDKKEFEGVFKEKCDVDKKLCIGCKLCIKSGCPSISFDKENKKAFIDKTSCVGCEVCSQICPKQAIYKGDK